MKHVNTKVLGLLIVSVSMAGCVAPIMGPTVAVMPAPTKPFVVFQQDTTECQQYANAVLAPVVQQANNQAVGQAIITTALGAALGAAIGGGNGAGIGAAAGAITGTSTAALSAQFAGMTIQQQFDIAYSQCMYSKGNQVPGFQPNVYVLPPPPGSRGYVPPPPGGYGAPGSAPPPPPPASEPSPKV